MTTITPCLWFDKNVEEAMTFYTSVFPNSKIVNKSYYDEASAEVSGMPKGSILVADVSLDGNKFMLLNGGPMFKFSQATSFVINCKDQKEVDYYWNKLTQGGEEQPCGWLIDKFGVAWQVTPVQLPQLLANPDRKKAENVMKAMLQMKKIDIAALEQAAKM